jgi:hypothetical protein
MASCRLCRFEPLTPYIEVDDALFCVVSSSMEPYTTARTAHMASCMPCRFEPLTSAIHADYVMVGVVSSSTEFQRQVGMAHMALSMPCRFESLTAKVYLEISTLQTLTLYLCVDDVFRMW